VADMERPLSNRFTLILEKSFLHPSLFPAAAETEDAGRFDDESL